DKAVHLWDTATGKEVRKLRGQAARTPSLVRVVAFSHDGKLLATGSFPDRGTHESTVCLWEGATRQQINQGRGQLGAVVSLTFSGDCKSLASAGRDGTCVLWDVPELLRGKPERQANLGPKELETLWAELAAQDAARGAHAVAGLMEAQKLAVTLLRQRLRPARALTPERTRQLLADLAHGSFALRAKATKELERCADAAEPELRRVLRQRASAEVRLRIDKLLKELDPDNPSPERLRGLRAIQALEHIGTPEARELLKSLTQGAPE